MNSPRLSKSAYIKGLQCPKALWLSRNRRELAKEPDESLKAIFATGDEIGKLATLRFSNGAEVDRKPWEVDEAARDTWTYIEQGYDAIFEATAIREDNGDFARIDILQRVEGADEWDLVEVKSSTTVQNYHYDDLAFQYYAFTGAGYKIRKCLMLVINNQYVRNGPIDPHLLLREEDITVEVKERQASIITTRQALAETLSAAEEPAQAISNERCRKPHECEFIDHCWKHVPDYSVYDFYKGDTLAEIIEDHGLDIKDVPQEKWPNGNQALHIQSYINNEVIVDRDALGEFLAGIEYPLTFLDYETVFPAVPQFDGTRPFQQVPFQFSIHFQEEPKGGLQHHEFLHKHIHDPRQSFVEELVRLCRTSGSVIVYNQPFEKNRNKELAEAFPEHADILLDINARMIDLYLPFQKRWLYHPSQKGSASIKYVLPAFTEVSYGNLDIGNGEQAMRQYLAFLKGAIPDTETEPLWDALFAYCKQDTYAMVRLLEILNAFAEPKNL